MGYNRLHRIFQNIFAIWILHLAEVEGVGPDMDEAIEGDEDQEHDQDGHNQLVN